jgi:2,3-bisphosphoglycerate-dependent phosphoglycerate mutase
MARTLILVRHGQSEWNLKNLFTGWRNPDLTAKGKEEAKAAGIGLKKQNYEIDLCYTSALVRAQHTLDIILAEMGIVNMTIVRNQALNERDYGDLSGLNKDDARIKWGKEQVHIWRRSFDTPPPGGESLKDTAERVLPYYKNMIEPLVCKGKTILVAAHGNSLRALVMHLEKLSPEEILKREIATGVPIIYHFDEDCHVSSVTGI